MAAGLGRYIGRNIGSFPLRPEESVVETIKMTGLVVQSTLLVKIGTFVAHQSTCNCSTLSRSLDNYATSDRDGQIDRNKKVWEADLIAHLPDHLWMTEARAVQGQYTLPRVWPQEARSNEGAISQSGHLFEFMTRPKNWCADKSTSLLHFLL